MGCENAIGSATENTEFTEKAFEVVLRCRPIFQEFLGRFFMPTCWRNSHRSDLCGSCYPLQFTNGSGGGQIGDAGTEIGFAKRQDHRFFEGTAGYHRCDQVKLL
jgi:hypothetical protein